MQEEIQYKKDDWRERLTTLDNIPGEPVHVSSDAWNKLNAKLERKAATVKPFWWLLAAACVAILFFLIGTLHKNEDHPVVKTDQIEPAKIVLYQPAPTLKQQSVATAKPNSPFVRRPVMEIATDTVVITPFSLTDSVPATSTYALIDTPPALPAKKLRVVHINELESNTVQRRNQLVRNTPSDKIIKIYLAPSN